MIFLFIFLGLFFSLNLIGDNVIIFTLISIITFIFLYKRFDKKIYLSYLIAFIVGIGLSFLNLKLNANSGSYLAIVIESKDNYYVVISKFEKLIIYDNNNVREVGDVLKINGSITDLVDTSLESEFSFVNYLNNKGITRELTPTNINVIFSNFIKLKAYRTHFLSLFDAGARDYIDAFLFANKNYDNTYIALSSSLNIAHLFSSSGIYLSIIFSIIEYFLFLKLDKKKTKIFSLLILSWYMIFSLNKIGVRRILYIKVFSLINEYKLKKKYSYLEVISLVGISMLVINKYLARQSGFYLGFFISLSLIFVRNALEHGRSYRFLSKTSVFIYLFMLPISISSGHDFHLLALPFQFILTPFTFFFSLSGLISFYTYPIKGYFNFLTTGLNSLIKGLSIIDVTFSFKEFTSVFILIYYLVLFLIIYYLESYQYRLSNLFGVCFICLFLYKTIPYEYMYADSISFINVGQGDSCVIRKNNKTIMVDTGGLTYKDISTNVTIPYLRKKGINRLDYVFISHSDNDHSGGLESLKSNFKVNEVIDTNKPFKITIAGIDFININKWADSFSDVNDKSQVLKFRVANKNILMMGDASKSIENKIMEEYPKEFFHIDILKVGHHGSNTSSSFNFLQYISPKEAVISVGKNNKYGHPSKEVISDLKSLNIKINRTDEIGTISYYQNSFLRA